MHPVTFPDPFARTSPALRVVVIIPARFESTRLPGKALADIGGLPMIEHVCTRAARARGVDAVIVATDDERIAAAVARFGGVARLTDPAHRTGTDRIAQVARDLPCEIVVNVQADEPLVAPEMIAEVIAPFRDPAVRMSTLRRAIEDPADIGNPNVVKVVVDRQGDALYFSRSPIPYVRGGAGNARRAHTLYRHTGIYAYRRELLLELTSLAQTPLEAAESLEQLRALEHGVRIRTIETSYDSIGVDTPEDLQRVRALVGGATAAARA